MKKRALRPAPCLGKRCRWTVWLVALAAVWLGACGPQDCVDFEDPAPGMTYSVGDTFSDSGVTITVLRFQWSNNNWTYDGSASVDDEQRSGGSGKDINANNVNLGFAIPGPLTGLTLSYGEYGGNVNIQINDEFQNLEDFTHAVIGGVTVTVDMGPGANQGKLTLTGPMDDFAFEEQQFTLVIGGQELWIDDVCWSK